MSMPISSRRSRWLVPIGMTMALVSGCHKDAADPFGGSGQAERIDCRVSGAAAFAHDCIVERTAGGDGLVLTIRHPDGGFRRLKVTRDGRGVIAADGGQGATVSVAGGKAIEVAIGNDRYRLPATVKSGGANAK